MKSNPIPELDKLFNEVRTYRKSSNLKELFQFIKRFRDIAPYNAMLLHIQKPGSQFVASAYDWSSKFNRYIKPGARPLIILRPFGPVSFVFELGDTEGKEPFPQELLSPFDAEGKLPKNAIDNLIKYMKFDGISYNEADHGTSSAGFIKVDNSAMEQSVISGKKEIWLKILYNMVVNKNLNQEAKFSTIVHELGHAYCGHLGTPDEKWWTDRHGLGNSEYEFEAESVCWLVCERMGIKNPSAGYLRGYLDNNGEIPDVSIDTVLKAVGMIEALIWGRKEPRKEIVTKNIEIKK